MIAARLISCADARVLCVHREQRQQRRRFVEISRGEFSTRSADDEGGVSTAEPLREPPLPSYREPPPITFDVFGEWMVSDLLLSESGVQRDT